MPAEKQNAIVYPPITPVWTNLSAADALNNEKTNKRDYSSMSLDDNHSDTSSSDRLSPNSVSSSSSCSPSRMPPKKRYANMFFNSSPPLFEKSNDNDDIDTPVLSLKGKFKQYHCKRCPFIAITNRDYRDHLRTHIKPNQLLACPNCPFITQDKHHYEAHLHNHIKSKPFKCPECEYTGVSKRSIQSHIKSHSTLCPYKCTECKYASKFCDRLKKHLAKTGHKEGFMLSEDGTFDKENVIVTESRREGATKKKGSKRSRKRVEIPVKMAVNSKVDVESSVLPNFSIDENVVPEDCEKKSELLQLAAPVDYSQKSPSPSYDEIEVESPIDLRDSTSSSLLLDLSQNESPKNDDQKCSYKLNFNIEHLLEDNLDENLTNDEVQQQIQLIRAFLSSMRQYACILEQNYL